MKMLFVILLIAGGLIYAANHGAFVRNSVQKSFNTQSDLVGSKKDTKVSINQPSVSDVDSFTKTNASSGVIKDGTEISIANSSNDNKDSVHDTNSQSQNDESDPYSAHIEVKELVSLPPADTSNVDTSLGQDTNKPTDDSRSLLQQLAQAGSLSEALTLLKDLVVPKNQNSTNQQSGSNSQANTSGNNSSNSQSGNTTVPTSPSDQNPVITNPKTEEVKKDSLVIVLPIDPTNTQTNTSGTIMTIKSNSTSNALLSICKTKYQNSKDVRVINQTAAFDLVSKTAQSMTFEVECL